MQYVGQTKGALKTRLKEHLFINKNVKNINTFLYKYISEELVIHDHLVKFWCNLMKKLYTSPILPKD